MKSNSKEKQDKANVLKGKKGNNILEWIPIILSAASPFLGFLQPISLPWFLIIVGLVVIVVFALMVLNKKNREKLERKIVAEVEAENKEIEIQNERLEIEHRITQNMALIVNNICNSHLEFKESTFDALQQDVSKEAEADNGDRITILAANLTYDLESGSVRMVADNLKQGVVYTYFIEDTANSREQMTKLCKCLQEQIPILCTLTNFIIYYVTYEKFLFNFMKIEKRCRSSNSLRFYFIKGEERKRKFMRISFDNDTVCANRLDRIINDLPNVATKISISDILRQGGVS